MKSVTFSRTSRGYDVSRRRGDFYIDMKFDDGSSDSIDVTGGHASPFTRRWGHLKGTFNENSETIQNMVASAKKYPRSRFAQNILAHFGN